MCVEKKKTKCTNRTHWYAKKLNQTDGKEEEKSTKNVYNRKEMNWFPCGRMVWMYVCVYLWLVCVIVIEWYKCVKIVFFPLKFVIWLHWMTQKTLNGKSNNTRARHWIVAEVLKNKWITVREKKQSTEDDVYMYVCICMCVSQIDAPIKNKQSNGITMPGIKCI